VVYAPLSRTKRWHLNLISGHGNIKCAQMNQQCKNYKTLNLTAVIFSSADVADLFSWLEIRKLQINAINSLLETSQLSNRADVSGVYQ